MTATGEPHASVEELELADLGDAVSYLGEEAAGIEEISGDQVSLLLLSPYENAFQYPQAGRERTWIPAASP